MNSFEYAVCPRVQGPHSAHGGRCGKCGHVVWWSERTQVAIDLGARVVCVRCAYRLAVTRPALLDERVMA